MERATEHETEGTRPAPDTRTPSLRRTFEEQLQATKDDVLRMGALVESQIQSAGQAMMERDVDLADRVRWADADVNELQRQINLAITSVIARQGPMARDIRELLALYHAAAELERMGDYATNIAKLAQQLAKEPELPIFRQIPRMEQLCREQLHSAMRALVDVSEEEARAVCRGDDEIDHLYNSVYEDAMSLMELSPERARQATHMLFAAHHLERLGDRVTNIGEDVVFLATGRVEDLNP